MCVCVMCVFSTVCISPNNDSLVPSSRLAKVVETLPRHLQGEHQSSSCWPRQCSPPRRIGQLDPTAQISASPENRASRIHALYSISEIIYEPYLIRLYMIYIDLFPAALVGHLVLFPQSIFSKSLAPPAPQCCRVQWNCCHS